MKYFLCFVVIIVLLPFYNFGQVTEKGKPLFNYQQKKEMPIIILPEVNLSKLEREDIEHSQSNLKSLRFADLIELDINLISEGVLDTKPNGDKVYYLSIKSAGAYSLSIMFDYFRLPKGAKLFVYSSDHKHVRGAFTYKNNKWNKILPIAPVKGDEIILEYHEPFSAEFKGEMHISTIAHDYKNIFKYLDVSAKGGKGSGSCNVNINCDDSEMWQLLKHSVCKITFNNWLCTGALINNTKQDGKAYFLTANHCISDEVDASAAIFYFNYEGLTCDNVEAYVDQTIAGSQIIATPPNKTIDFSLLELSVNPPPAYQPYYSGWNRDMADPTSVTSIHHPSGDIKKISKSYDGAITGSYGEGFVDFAHWWIDEWDEGTTEGGSSGSPLFDQNGLIIGDLTGGEASCAFNFNDYYQQFHRSWNEYSDSSFSLMPWLDPVNAGVVSINGYLPYDTIPSHLKAKLSDTIVNLTWNDVVDTANIKFYYVYRNSVKIDSVETSQYEDTLSLKNVLNKYFVTVRYKAPEEYESQPSNVAIIRTMDTLDLPFVEKYEGQFAIPDNWYEERTVDTVGWEFKTGGFEGQIDTAFEGSINACFYGKNNESSKLVLPRFDLSGYGNVKLSFYMHMQEKNDSIHNLNVLYKKTDSLSWECLRSYNVSAEDWAKKEVSLVGLSSEYQIAFEGVGMGGYGICIDSVSIIEDNEFVDPHFAVNKDTICINDSIEFSTNTDVSNDFYWDFGSTAVPNNATGPGPHMVKYNSSGIKSVKLIVNDVYIKSESEAVVVSTFPEVPEFSNYGNELISNSESGNQWYLNDSPIEGAVSDTYIIKEDGYYAVEIKNKYNCFSISESKYMILNTTEEVIEDEISDDFSVYPNPNNGSFTVKLGDGEHVEQLDYKLVDITGKIQQSGKIEPYEKSKNIHIDNPNEGVYFIQIYSTKNYLISKILIRK